MNTVFHCVFAVLAILFFTWRFCHNREAYQLLLLLWIPSTFLIYISSNRLFSIIVSIGQLVVFFLFLYFYFKTRKAREAKQKKLSQLQKAFHKLQKDPHAEIEVLPTTPEPHEENTAPPNQYNPFV